jgi:aspartate/methionine/tyrosine aminotransferase
LPVSTGTKARVFPPIAYLEWIEGRPAAATYDFGSSDLKRDCSGVVPPRLRGLTDPPDEVELETQIADTYGPAVEPENVLVTAGATQANALAAATALGPDGPRGGDAREVVVESPGYEPLHSTPRGLGAGVGTVARDPADHRLDPEVVAQAVTDETALVTVTNRHNPSGRLTDRETLAMVAGHAARHDAVLLVDEVYAPFDGQGSTGPGTAFGGPTAAGLERTVITGSLTKFLGYGPLRVGWLVGPAAFVDRARSAFWHLPSVAHPSRHLARRIFANLDRVVEHSHERVRENHALLAEFAADRDDLTGDVPDGSTMALLAHERATGDEVTEAALDAGVLVVPGRFFGSPEGFRITLGKRGDEMARGLDVLGEVLDDLAAGDSPPSP